jgi:hypothetical protein
MNYCSHMPCTSLHHHYYPPFHHPGCGLEGYFVFLSLRLFVTSTFCHFVFLSLRLCHPGCGLEGRPRRRTAAPLGPRRRTPRLGRHRRHCPISHGPGPDHDATLWTRIGIRTLSLSFSTRSTDSKTFRAARNFARHGCPKFRLPSPPLPH